MLTDIRHTDHSEASTTESQALRSSEVTDDKRATATKQT